MQWTVRGLAFYNGFTVCLAVFALLFGVLALLLSWPCLGNRVAATVADFVIILQLYLVKTQARPTLPAFQQGNKIALLSHIASFRLPTESNGGTSVSDLLLLCRQKLLASRLTAPWLDR